MKEKSILIIGAGLAGLATGCYARMNGYRTRILEQHSIPGGLCTAWKRKGYTFDGCIHWLMGARPGSWFHQLYEEVGALEGNRLIYLDHYIRFLSEPTGHTLDITADLDQFGRDLKAISPQDAAAIDELLAGVQQVKGVPIYPEQPYDLMSAADYQDHLLSMQPVMRYLTRDNISVAEFARRFQNPLLQWVLVNVFIDDMPLLFLLMLLAHLQEGELAVVESGSLGFVRAIIRRYRNLGGELTCNADVREILVEGDRAVGVRLADGSEQRADVIVSAADGYATIFELLGGRYVDPTITEPYKAWQPYPPLIMISLGVNKRFAGWPYESLVYLQRPLVVGSEELDRILFRIFDYNPTLAAPGKTAVQALLSGNYEYWMALQHDRPRYEAEKKRIAAEVQSRLEPYLPGLTAQTEVVDVATPYTFWRYTRNYRGSYEGWILTPAILRTHVKKTLPGLDNFYMAGHWVEPGGGVPVSICSGRQVVQLLCHRDGKPFNTTIF